MLRIAVATVLLSSPLSVSAQTYSHTQKTISGSSYQTLETYRGSLGSQMTSTRDNSPDAKQCLSRKKTSRVECHTYAEWVEIARAIEAGRK